MIELKRYLFLLNAIFFLDEEAEPDSRRIKPSLFTVENEKMKYKEQWENFIHELREKKKFRVRDMSRNAQKNSFTGFSSYDDSSKGIIFAISFPFKCYGFRYERMIPKPDSQHYHDESSYLFFDEEMREYQKRIEEILQNHFPGLIEFDNNLAEIKIEKIRIYDVLYKNLDLWKAVLSTYDDGLV